MEQRRTRRFQLHLPLAIIRSGAERVALSGLTNNISSSGVQFTTEGEADLGGSIEYIISLNHDGPEPVNLRCMGKVIRSVRKRDEPQGANYEVAATLERYEFVRERTAH